MGKGMVVVAAAVGVGALYLVSRHPQVTQQQHQNVSNTQIQKQTQAIPTQVVQYLDSYFNSLGMATNWISGVAYNSYPLGLSDPMANLVTSPATPGGIRDVFVAHGIGPATTYTVAQGFTALYNMLAMR